MTDISKNDTYKKTGMFWYQSDEDDYKAVYVYSDSYFRHSSFVYNNSLSTMSMCLAFSAFASTRTKDCTEKSQNAKNLLEQLKFEYFEANKGYLEAPTEDSIGAVAAIRKFTLDNGNEIPLLAVAVRGGGYQREWASNFTIGEAGDHEGFSEAKDKVIDFLKKYVKSHFIKGCPIKLWIAGYSRAAAVSNLVAAEINKMGRIENCTIAKQDLYAYTFATPAGALKPNASGENQNIFNTFNYNDPVEKVAPKTMNFKRYGNDVLFPLQTDSDYETKKDNMIAFLKNFESRNVYQIDDFCMKKFVWNTDNPNDAYVVNDTKNNIIQGKFLDKFVKDLVNEKIVDRDNYMKEFQSSLRTVFGRKRSEFKMKIPEFGDKLIDILQNRIAIFIAKRLPKANAALSEREDLDFLIYEMVNEILFEERLLREEADNIHKEPFLKDLKFLIKTIIEFGVVFPDSAVTLIYNIKPIRSGHFPEYCLAWLQSMDSNYS